MSCVRPTLLSVGGASFLHSSSPLPSLEQVLLEPTAGAFIAFLATLEIVAPVVV